MGKNIDGHYLQPVMQPMPEIVTTLLKTPSVLFYYPFLAANPDYRLGSLINLILKIRIP